VLVEPNRHIVVCRGLRCQPRSSAHHGHLRQGSSGGIGVEARIQTQLQAYDVGICFDIAWIVLKFPIAELNLVTYFVGHDPPELTL
jgi:hypothetical protein